MRKLLAILMALVLFLQAGLCMALAEGDSGLASDGASTGASGGESADDAGTDDGGASAGASSGESGDTGDASGGASAGLSLDTTSLEDVAKMLVTMGLVSEEDANALLESLGDLSQEDLAGLLANPEEALKSLLGTEEEAQFSWPVVSMSIFVDATADGPEMTKIIAELDKEASSVAAEGVTLNIAGSNFEPGPVYLCDENGEPAGQSRFVAFEKGEFIPDENDDSSSPGMMSGASLFTRTDMSISVWADSFQVTLHADSFVVDGEAYVLDADADCINNRICPAAALFNYRAAWTGSYLNQITGETEEQLVSMAAYEPDSLAGGEKNPLIIWLHGQGEGGHDPDIAILGNEVSALAKDSIQGYFSAGDQIGAYVLVPQVETYWMDEGDNTNGQGAGVSRYTQALMDAINDYLAHNDDVDQNRLYIGGCSNGGYMTLNMLVEFPGVFAAAYPVCEGYSYYAYIKENGHYVESEKGSAGSSGGEAAEETEPAEDEEPEIIGVSNCLLDPVALWLTEDKIQLLKDDAIWFVFSSDDPLILPYLYELPTFTALIQAGAENCYMSVFSGYGHGVWVALFQNLVTGVQNNALYEDVEIQGAADAVLADYPIQANAATGGDFSVDGFDTIFAWMNAQSK